MVTKKNIPSANKSKNPEMPSTIKSAVPEPDKKLSSKKANKVSEIKNPHQSRKSNKILERIKEPPWLKIIRKWLIGLSTLGMFIYTISLFHQTKQQSMDASAKADSSFALSKKIADTQERFAKIENRAYVVIKDINLILPPAGSGRVGWVEYENIGRTPAYKCRNRLCIYFDSTMITLQVIQKFMFSFEASNASEFVLGTANPLQQQFPTATKFTETERRLVTGRKMMMFAFGTITYEDIFHETHRSNFCGLWDPTNLKTLLLPIFNDAK